LRFLASNLHLESHNKYGSKDVYHQLHSLKSTSMKKLLILLVSVSLLSAANAQLTTKTKCPDFVVDILDGKVSGSIKASSPDYDIKRILPCFTGSQSDGSTSKCGGGVFYKDKDIYFYTDRDYIQIGEKFKGKLTIPLLGAKRNSFFKTLGNPKMTDDAWDAWQMSYGTLVLHYNKAGKVNLIQISTNGMNTLSLCE
jgi:hypothetical protein